MSFEGRMEYICAKGHYCSSCVYNDINACPHCKSKFKYSHLVDETNGYEEDNPSTYEAPTKEIGFEDKWHEDHYGNKYATKIFLFEPVGPNWRTLDDTLT